MADIAVIATPDRLHVAPAIAMARLGYHLLVEKPMAIDEEDCRLMAKAVSEAKVLFAVAHVLRYMPTNRLINDLMQSGVIGEVLHISHTEPVGWYHFAHSYVRGNWNNEKKATFSLMAKCW